MTKFDDKVNEALKAPLSSSAVKDRAQGGRKLSYIEGWHAIAEANRIFGFDGWTRETLDLKMVAEHERGIGNKGDKGWGVTYTSRVRITVGDVVREGCGSGHGIDRDLGLAHESALKEAETDAMKRALMTFGNPFGLALYDKTQANVIDDAKDEKDEEFPLMLPGNAAPYQTLGSAGAWIEAANDMCARIRESKKYADEDKGQKLKALEEVNRPVYDKLDAAQRKSVSWVF